MGKFSLNEFDDFNAGGEAKKTTQPEPAVLKASSNECAVRDTAAKKAAKMPMMNIRFSEANYKYVRREASTRGLSVIAFVNQIVDEYRKQPENVHKNDAYQDPNAAALMRGFAE